MSMFADGAYVAWALLAIGALALEFFTGTMIFLSLALALAVVAFVSWALAPGLGLLLLIGTVLWVGFSLLLKTLFGSWGSTTAVADPNEYLLSSQINPSMDDPEDAAVPAAKD